MTVEFDSFLVKAKIGASRTLRRLTPAERWCYVAGVLALAAESPIRGALLITEGEAVTVADLADQAGVPKTTASSTVSKLKRLGKLEHDDELGCLIVVRWHAHQVEPKPSDSRDAWRERKRRQRERSRDSHAGQQRDMSRDSHAKVTPPEVKGRKEKPPLTPPPGGNRRRDLEKWKQNAVAWMRSLGVDGPDEKLLKALNGAAPWKQNDDAAAHLRSFVVQYWPDLLGGGS